MDYRTFLDNKKHLQGNYGIETNYLPSGLFDYQEYVANYSIKKGRCAVFLDTGLGKTLIELTIAKNYIHHTNKPVLIITPLAVAFQFIKEAEKFGIDDIEYSKDGKYTKKIVVANYERLHYFSPSDFDCVVLDESSILKNFDGAIKADITTFLKKVKYRYLFTATPSPNDFIELGTSSEALGYLGYTDMLTRFFTNNEDTVSPMNIGTEWILKGHAKENFFKWVSGWSISMRKPSDLGFDDSRHILPELKLNYHSVKNEKNMVINGQIQMFNQIARTNTEVHEERKLTIEQRCEKAADLAMQHDISMLWCNLNPEGDLLEKLIPGSIQVSGRDSLEYKEEAIRWFIGDFCICNSPNFRSKLAIKCGNQNTRNGVETNTKLTNGKEKEGNLKVEALKRTKSICKTIIKIIQTDLKETNPKTLNETEKEESDTLQMKIIEQNLEISRFNGEKEIQLKNAKDFLSNMESLLNIITNCLKIKITDVRYVEQQFREMVNTIDCILTTVTLQEKLEDYYAPNAILDLENSKTASNCSNPQSCICGHISGVRRLISKTKIFGFGLNLQHCNHTVYFPTFSYEQYYQAIRRFWRFGQLRSVTVDLVYSDGQKRVLDSLLAKTEKADQLFSKLNSTLHQDFNITKKEFDKQIKTPSWLKIN